MNEKTRLKKQPAHELIPVLIAWLDEKRSTTVVVEGRMVFEMAIEKVCQMVGMMVIPEQHLPALVEQIEVLSKHTNSRMVQQNLVDLATYLKTEVKPADQQA
jgi:hypothetical protein